MFRLSDAQLSGLSAASYERFVQKSLPFLRQTFSDTAGRESEDALRGYIDRISQFAVRHRVFAEINVQKLMVLHRRTGFAIPLPRWQAHLLRRAGFSEDERVMRLTRAVLTGEVPELVTLRDDLPARRAAR
ncbi:hypothetical protein [Vannielia litorea]|uniref:hypothetical protein n=1 Tax=Vannielia litorea TaxID=1217970 RepID=UPI001BD0EDF5|nr:hypothetical protein [Vannielia litorea]MBS8226403.1 hypothetical protein [Vannielia litorea]